MAHTTRDDIRRMLSHAAERHTHMIVVCDTFDFEDYPVFVEPEEDIKERIHFINGRSMQRVMEVYDLRKPLEPQIEAVRAWNL